MILARIMEADLRVAFLNYHFDPEIPTPDDLLMRYSTLTGYSDALVQSGADVAVFQRFHTTADLSLGHVRYTFRPDGSPARRKIPHLLHAEIQRWSPDIIHIHGLLYPWLSFALRRIISPATALIAQHHAEQPLGGYLALLRKLAFRSLDGVVFASQSTGHDWIRRHNLSSRIPIAEIMEGSTDFLPGDCLTARHRTGLSGSPVFLWVGRLNPNKDPLTVLQGFKRIRHEFKDARLYMIYSSEELIENIRIVIDETPELRDSAGLLGTVPHSALQDYYRSADYFVSGSHYEGSGYALCEAIACGITPVVTNIPSFRMMTDGGRIGALWSPGDPDSFTESALGLMKSNRKMLCEEIRAFFNCQLSWNAIARKTLAFYSELLDERRKNLRRVSDESARQHH